MANISTDKQKIKQILTRGVHEVYTYKELEEKLLSGKQLHIKLGIDVTGPTIHLGHAVVQRKLRDFQELGHKVTLIIGDFTTLVGDHSDKVEMRSETNSQLISEDEKTYKEQFFKTVFESQAEVRHNSEWLKKLTFGDAIELTKQFTVAQMLDRETFMIRYKNNKPIGLDEFLYPLMQGYDSVALECDVELGGTDQTFNLLAGRKLMENRGMVAQNAMSMKLLTGADGRPMGKSLKNFIPVNADHKNMYGQVMSIVDEVIWEYFELSTRIPMDEVTQMRHEVENGANPMEFKKTLAKDIVTFYHGADLAREAEQNFKDTVQGDKISEDNIKVVAVKQVTNSAEASILQVLKPLTKEVSNRELKERFKNGAIELNDKKITDINEQIKLKKGDIIKYGKRKYIKID